MSLSIGNKIVKLITTDSTNNYAKTQIGAENWPEGTIIQAEYQTQGKGQIGNSWESEAGKNLLCSIVLTPHFLPILNQFLISKIVALSVAQVVGSFVGEVSIKWPNDIYVGEKKIAGILIENSLMGHRIEHSIAGIGLNINQERFLSAAPNPVSLFQLTGKNHPIEVLLNQFADQLSFWYEKLSSGQTSMIDTRYTEQLFRRGQPARYQDHEGEFEGILLGVNEIGQLLIQDSQQKIKSYHFKEVVFLPQHDLTKRHII